MRTRNIKALPLARDIRAGMDDTALMQRYRLSAEELEEAVRMLRQGGFINEMDVYLRTTLSERDAGLAIQADLGQAWIRSSCDDEISDQPGKDKRAVSINSEYVFTTEPAMENNNGKAVIQGSDSTFTRAASGNARAGGKNGTGKSLMVAAWKGSLESARSILNNGVNVNARSKFGNTPLILSLFKGHVEIARVLLEKGADVEARNQAGNTPLMGAARAGNAELVELLLAKGAEVQGTNTAGDTPLLVAARKGDAETVKLLLAGGADMNYANKTGETAITCAMDRGYKELEKLLMRNAWEPVT